MVEKFKFWCQKVLPTIYDDSLSYYEAICKMATYLDATIDQVNEFQKMIEALPETILNSEEFQKMVQDAVDGKIDALYKVVQDALDAFDKEIDTKFAGMKSELDADQAAFEKQVNDNNTAFKKQIEKDFTTLELTTKHRMDVQDDKITNQNTTIESFKTEVNGKLTSYETSDAQFKQEVNTKLSGYESDNAQFKSQVNAKVDEIPTKIAEYPKYPLCQNSNGAVTNLFNVLMTYYHNSDLKYGNFNTPFNTEVSGQPTIDCSSLVQLCLMGVPYNQARFTTDQKNVATSGYYFGDDLIIDPEANRPYGMLSDDMCRWFVEHGYYFETDDPTQLKPGDVVFMTFNTESPTYKHVTHCNFFVSYQAITDELWCIGASTTNDVRPFVVSRESYKRTSESFVGFGRLPLPDCDFKPVDLMKGVYQDFMNKSITLSPENRLADMGRIRLPNSLMKSKIYTLVMKVINGNTPLYFTLQSGTNNLTNITIPNSHSVQISNWADAGEWVYVPFVLNFQNTPEISSVPIDAGLNLYVLSLYARILSTETSTVSRTIYINNCSLYEGVVMSPIDAVERQVVNSPVYDLDLTTNYDQYSILNMWNAFEASDYPLSTASSMSAMDNLLGSPYIKAHKLSCIPIACRGITNVSDGNYLLLTFTSATGASAHPANGCQYLFGITVAGIYSRHAANSAWGNFEKIAPYTAT